MFEHIYEAVFDNFVTRACATSVQRLLCPCHSWRAIGSPRSKANYMDFVLHVILKVLVTFFFARYVLLWMRKLQTRFKRKVVHWMLEVAGYVIAIWLPLRLLWPGLFFVASPLKHVATFIPGKIKPCSDSLICFLSWFEVAVALLALLLLFLLPLSFHLWENFDSDYLRRFRNLCRRFHISMPRFTWLRNFCSRYCPRLLWLRRCFALLANSLRKYFDRIPGLAWLRDCFRPAFPIIAALLALISTPSLPPWLRNRPHRCTGIFGGGGSEMNAPSSSHPDQSHDPSSNTAATKPSGSRKSRSPSRESPNPPTSARSAKPGSRKSPSPGRKSPNRSNSPGPSSRGPTLRSALNRPSTSAQSGQGKDTKKRSSGQVPKTKDSSGGHSENEVQTIELRENQELEIVLTDNVRHVVSP